MKYRALDLVFWSKPNPHPYITTSKFVQFLHADATGQFVLAHILASKKVRTVRTSFKEGPEHGSHVYHEKKGRKYIALPLEDALRNNTHMTNG